MSGWLDFDRYAVFGMGKSGVAAANLLARRGKSVLASDSRASSELGAVAEKLDTGVELVGGQNAWEGAEVVVVSPGLKPSLAVFAALDAAKIPVISEIELAFSAAEAPIIAITGTDGKSTTTVLVEHLLKAAGCECVAGGNLGTPLCDLVDEISPDGYLVAEVSAFQLWTTHRFSPAAAGLTNIAFDHLDYFETYAEYVESKRRVLLNAGAQTLGVFNFEDAYIRQWVGGFKGRALAYGLSEEAVKDAPEAFWLEGDNLSARIGGETYRGWLSDIKNLPISGAHNMLNLMCAAGLAQLAGLSLPEIAEAARTFKPLAHRLEFVAEVDGVRFYDDSKATNVHAALAGLRSFEGRLVPIVGGVDKGLELSELVEFVKERAVAVVVIGELRERFSAELLAAGYASDRVVFASNMAEAVVEAKKIAGLTGDGGIVSLSPACSSFDMFKSYAHRGEVFQEVVAALKH